MNNKTEYDEIVSLGYNCEISFRIRDYFGKLNSWPFSWSYIRDRKKFVQALDNLEGIFQGSVSYVDDERIKSMIQCDTYGICFHPRGEYVSSEGMVDEIYFEVAVEEIRNRLKHLIDKFQYLINSDKRSLFFVGISTIEKDDPIVFINQLGKWLDRKYLSKKYTLVAIMDKKMYNEYKEEINQIDNKNIYVRYIKAFGTQKCNDISTDSVGWWKILSEFCYPKQYGFFYRLTMHRIVRLFCAIKKRMRV